MELFFHMLCSWIVLLIFFLIILYDRCVSNLGWNRDVFYKREADIHFCYLTLSLYFPGEGGPPDTTFIEDAVLELLKTRRILKCSYPYGFFLEPKSTKKEIYELMQVSVPLIQKKNNAHSIQSYMGH